MRVTFKIEYHTVWGESLSLSLCGGKHPMVWNDGDIWSVTVDSVKQADLKEYGYLVMRDGLISRI